MSTKTITALILLISLTSLAACEKANNTPSTDNKQSPSRVSKTEDIIDDNVESIEKDYRQQAYDSLPPKQTD